MVNKKLVVFTDDIFFSEAASILLLERGIDFVCVSSFGELISYLVDTPPFMLFVTDHVHHHFNAMRVSEIRAFSPDTAIAIFTYRTLAAKEVWELKNLRDVSVITVKNSLNVLGLVIDVLYAGYRVFDSNSTCDNQSKGFYQDVNLSPMESKVLTMMVQGMSVRSTSKILNIAEKTVMTYKQRSLSKLGVHSLREFLLS